MIIYFDGVCNLCNGFIDFLIKRDKRRVFKYTSLQGKKGQDLLLKHKLPTENLSSVILEKDGVVYIKAKAAIKILSALPGAWFLFSIFKIVPLFISNYVYDVIAKNRYNWFGKKESCRLPTAEEREFFI
jgi:predicted DCC family thiol-disulfide oxidoreductase YuxK